MAESESLRDFVARNRHLPPDEALGIVLSMPKVRAWIGEDPGRRDRLTAEFRRLWEEFTVEPTPKPAAPAALPRTEAPRAPAADTPRAPPRPVVSESAPVVEVPTGKSGPHVGPAHARSDEALVTTVAQKPIALGPLARGRHEKFICTSCGGYDIYSEFEESEVAVRCRQCKTEFPDLLQLIPVIEVGPFELFFGRGREAYVKLAAIVTLWIAVALLLKYLV